MSRVVPAGMRRRLPRRSAVTLAVGLAGSSHDNTKATSTVASVIVNWRERSRTRSLLLDLLQGRGEVLGHVLRHRAPDAVEQLGLVRLAFVRVGHGQVE